MNIEKKEKAKGKPYNLPADLVVHPDPQLFYTISAGGGKKEKVERKPRRARKEPTADLVTRRAQKCSPVT